MPKHGTIINEALDSAITKAVSNELVLTTVMFCKYLGWVILNLITSDSLPALSLILKCISPFPFPQLPLPS